MIEDVTSDSWTTPADLAAALGHFAIDPYSNARSHIQAARSLSLENGDDGDAAEWVGLVFANPGYSRDRMRRASVRLAAHDRWVALIKLDTTTQSWARLMTTCSDWAPFRKRVKFERPDKKPMVANFASALVWRDWTPPAALRSWLWLRGYQQATTKEAI